LFGDARRQCANRIGSDLIAARQLRQSRHLQLLREPRRLPARLFRQLRGASLPAQNRLIERRDVPRRRGSWPITREHNHTSRSPTVKLQPRFPQFAAYL
jgi:hypothetical protein